MKLIIELLIRIYSRFTGSKFQLMPMVPVEYKEINPKASQPEVKPPLLSREAYHCLKEIAKSKDSLDSTELLLEVGKIVDKTFGVLPSLYKSCLMCDDSYVRIEPRDVLRTSDKFDWTTNEGKFLWKNAAPIIVNKLAAMNIQSRSSGSQILINIEEFDKGLRLIDHMQPQMNSTGIYR